MPAAFPASRAPRRPTTRSRRHGVLTVALALTLMLLTACGVRLETPPPAVPTPDAAEQIRAEAVADATAITTSAQAASADPAAAGVLERLEQVAAGSQVHSERLGGTWTPPAYAETPATTTGTDIDTDADSVPADLVGTITMLTAGYEHAKTGLAESSGDTSQLLASIALWRALAAHELAGALAQGAPSLPVGGLDTTALSLASFRDVDPLIRGLDAAAYSYEVLAAREGDAARQQSWNARGTRLREAGQLVATQAGVAGGAADPRAAIYDVSALLTADPTASVAALEVEVARLWITSELPASARTLGVDAALESLLLGRSLAPTAPLDSPAVVLPGLLD